MSKSEDWHRETALIRSGINRTGYQETSEAPFMTLVMFMRQPKAAAAFKGQTGNFVYSRYGNPTLLALEQRLAKLEGAEACVSVASAWQLFLRLWLASYLRGSCSSKPGVIWSCYAILTKILPRWGVEVELLDGRDLNAWKEALAQPAKLVFFETPSNPVLQLVDIEAVSALAHAAGAKVIVDNVFATPLYQSPLALGADIVTYSTTKHIDGHGRL